MKKRYIILILIIFLFSLIIFWQYPRLNIISGYAAKNMCSCMYEGHRTPESIKQTDNNFAPIDIAEYEIDTTNKSVTASVFGFMKRKAVYNEDMGCQLLISTDKYNDATPFPVPHNCPRPTAYPYGHEPQKDTVFPNVDYKKLQQAVNRNFDKNGNDSLKTRSLLVLYKDHIIAEKYADGFNKESRILGWSMTKSVLATLFGILEKQGRIHLNDTHLFTEWKQDKRAKISLKDLLQMSSGLEWEENYEAISDVTKMLFLEEDMPLAQLQKPLKYPVGSHWNYSSGTTNLLSKLLRDKFYKYQDYLDFPVKELYDKLAMKSMSVELDFSGNYVFSSYGWATTRDWAKLGVLYLHNGNWNGTQIIDTSWVDFVKIPCKDSKGRYGGHFWLNAGGKYPDVPKDIYSMDGYQGQMVFIIPSKDMVIVRMGLTEGPEFDFNKMLREIVATIH